MVSRLDGGTVRLTRRLAILAPVRLFRLGITANVAKIQRLR
jgi:hypothetical protein